MNDNKKEFLEFLTQSELPPKYLSLSTQKDILLTFRKKSILFKFLFFQFLGAYFTLFFCPQFGIGFVEGHGIAHIFRLIGDWACAAFCGSLFLSAGMIISYLGMKGEELWWVWKHYRYTLILFPTIMWSSLMLINISFESQTETISYHLTWILFSILAQIFWMSLRSHVYTRSILTN